MRWVAVEGPCCAGKTTLARGLLDALDDMTLFQVVCYADHVGGGRFLPRPTPETVAEDAAALTDLLAIEADRVAAARASSTDLVLMDRSVHTLLAHRYALQRVTGLACFAAAERVIAQSTAPAWPDVVVFLDVPQQTVLDRNRGKFPPDSIFIDARLNAGIRAYFSRLAELADDRVMWLDATVEPAKLVTVVESQIRELLNRHYA
jgi:thymidylate kinase